MKNLNLPAYPFRLRKKDERREIFDEVRKKWLVCTPEEWVRQHFIQWLIAVKKYPASNISIEGGLKINQLQKRTDIICYGNGKPLLLVECKAPDIKLSQETFNQLFRYNHAINARLLAITNGVTHIFAELNKRGEPEQLSDLPPY
jgi:hypothetical protein